MGRPTPIPKRTEVSMSEKHHQHSMPECPNCGSQLTRPLDDSVAVCFDCDNEWRGEFNAE
jgi:ribosomal protein L37AE/L43A